MKSRFALSLGSFRQIPTLLTIFLAIAAGAAPATLNVDVAHPGHTISPLLYGIFFEDINCSADGGLYAEMVRNRNFEDSDQPNHWSAVADSGAQVRLAVDSADPVSPKNRHALKVSIESAGSGRAGVANEGFWGMSVVKGRKLQLSLFAKPADKFSGRLHISLEGKGGAVYAEAVLPALAPGWKEYKLTLTAKETDPKARLVITSAQPGEFWLDMVSLFPEDTWKKRSGGLRPDLAEMLLALKPGFVRFPGGCWVEGDTMALAYRWKQTIGDPSQRRTQHNIWQYEATHGLGYHEYLQLCEDLHAEPLFVVNCGMSHKEVVPMDKMPEFVQDALDTVEYANGPSSTTWGARRAQNGHPASFNLKYMEIGNENGGPAYHERYALFYDAIKAKYPQMHLVANEWGGTPKNRPIELVDEHYYSTPEFFIHNAGKYDSYDRSGRKVYVGEYAVTQACGEGNLRAAVGEAAFMTGMERNSDVVLMASYAPLFANVNYKKWNPDLINFDTSRAYGLPSYYVQKMFSENRGDVLVPVSIEARETPPPVKSGAIGVGTWHTEAEFKDLKVTSGGETLLSCDFADGTKGWRLHSGDWSVKDGALRQKALGENIRAFAGDKSWKNYTYSLRARKLSGAEGFLIAFLVQDETAKAWWNIGGWGNTRHAIEMDGVTAGDASGRIETGRWYNIRIEVSDARIRCYLDNQLVHDVIIPATKPLYAVGSLRNSSRELILKLVNVSGEEQDTEIKINGAGLAGSFSQTLLASTSPQDENTLEQPGKVSPMTSTSKCAGSGLRQTLPANSVTVLSLKLR